MSGATLAAILILVGAALIYWALVGLNVIQEVSVTE